MKMVSVSLSDECIHTPLCKFCYVNYRPVRESQTWRISHTLWGIRRDHIEERVSVCFEYNGYNVHGILRESKRLHDVSAAVTTMPEIITPVFCGAMRNSGIDVISMSFDSEKIDMESLNTWVLKARMIRDAGLQVGCNFLIEEIPIYVPLAVLGSIDQLNLLSLKPTGKYSESELLVIKLSIEQLKEYTRVTTDNCLGVQLGLIDGCKRGIDFIHVLPDGTTEDCCFKAMCYLYEDKE